MKLGWILGPEMELILFTLDWCWLGCWMETQTSRARELGMLEGCCHPSAHPNPLIRGLGGNLSWKERDFREREVGSWGTKEPTAGSRLAWVWNLQNNLVALIRKFGHFIFGGLGLWMPRFERKIGFQIWFRVEFYVCVGWWKIYFEWINFQEWGLKWIIGYWI